MTKKNFEILLEEAVVSDPGGLEGTLIKENENYQKDLWRSYGPGRYDNYATMYVDEFIGNGFADDECGEAESTNHYALVRGPFKHPSLSGQKGAIVETTGQGFVSAEFFESKPALEKKWEEICSEISEMMEGAEAEDY